MGFGNVEGNTKRDTNTQLTHQKQEVLNLAPSGPEAGSPLLDIMHEALQRAGGLLVGTQNKQEVQRSLRAAGPTFWDLSSARVRGQPRPRKASLLCNAF